MTAAFQCAGCGEWNSTLVDETAGREQTYVEDCQVCCRPNLLRIRYYPEEDAFVIARPVGITRLVMEHLRGDELRAHGLPATW
jgi:hypothetical protein